MIDKTNRYYFDASGIVPPQRSVREIYMQEVSDHYLREFMCGKSNISISPVALLDAEKVSLRLYYINEDSYYRSTDEKELRMNLIADWGVNYPQIHYCDITYWKKNNVK